MVGSDNRTTIQLSAPHPDRVVAFFMSANISETEGLIFLFSEIVVRNSLGFIFANKLKRRFAFVCPME